MHLYITDSFNTHHTTHIICAYKEAYGAAVLCMFTIQPLQMPLYIACHTAGTATPQYTLICL